MFKKYCSTFKLHSRRYLSLQKLDVLDWKKQEQILLEPIQHIIHVTNKQCRMMVPTFNHWLQVPKEKLEIIQEITDISTAQVTLLDDIQDNSALRSGSETISAQRVFGLGLTVNSLSHAMLVITKKLIELDHPLALETFLNRNTEFHVGQGSELYWQDKNIYASDEKMFYDIITIKNGSVFAYPVELMQLFSSKKEDVVYPNLASTIGVYLTLVDDYYNIFHPKELRKLTGAKQIVKKVIPDSDITEGKITLPVIHAMQYPDVASELTDILKQRTSDPKLMTRFMELLKKHGSGEYAKDAMKKMDADIRKEIDQLGGNPSLTALMDELEY